MLNNVIIITMLAAGGAIFAFGAMSLRVLFALARRGPGAADEAYESGETFGGWIDPSTAASATGPQEKRRLADCGRRHSRFGEVMVEERASSRIYDL